MFSLAKFRKSLSERIKAHPTYGLSMKSFPEPDDGRASDINPWLNGEPAGPDAALSNPIAYRCIRLVVESAAYVPWMLKIDLEHRERHPASKLLRNPNQRDSGHQFFERLYGHLLLYGNAYVSISAGDLEISNLHTLDPTRVTAERGSDGWPVRYRYTCGSSELYFPAEGYQEPEEAGLLTLSSFAPQEHTRGTSSLHAARASIDLHQHAIEWNRALYENSARPSGALIYSLADGAHLTDQQFNRLKQELSESYQGSKNAGRPLLLDGGLDWKPMSHSPRDMDFLQAKSAAARDIALAFGVPPLLLGIPGDNTYANFQEASRSFWRQSILPLVTRTAVAFSTWLSTRFGEELDFTPDINAIDALAPERCALWESVAKADFFTIAEKRKLVGLAEISESPDHSPGKQNPASSVQANVKLT